MFDVLAFHCHPTYLRMGVEHGKVADNDGHGKCNRQHTGQGTQRSNEHADVGFRCHIAVADGGHRHNGPPQPKRYAFELVVRIILRVVEWVESESEIEEEKTSR